MQNKKVLLENLYFITVKGKNKPTLNALSHKISLLNQDDIVLVKV